jgi:pyruvate-formate lyase-activating enzyme
MSYDVFKKIVNKCYTAKIPHIHICGNGEPTINPDFLKCLDYVIKKYGHVSFQSNFDSKIYENKNLVKEIIKRKKYIDYITMDLVGYDRSTHNNLKLGSDIKSIIEIMTSINKGAPEVKFYVHWILTKLNYKGIDNLLLLLKKRKINFKLDIVNLHAYEFNDFCSLESRYLKSDKNITRELNYIEKFAKIHKLEVNFPKPVDVKTEKCGGFWSRVQIGFASHDIPKEKWHGNFLPVGGCDAVVKGKIRSFGNILNKDIMSVWNGKSMKAVRKNLIKGIYPDEEACKGCQNYIVKK